jgi:hypothetical protein
MGGASAEACAQPGAFPLNLAGADFSPKAAPNPPIWHAELREGGLGARRFDSLASIPTSKFNGRFVTLSRADDFQTAS